MALDIEAPSKAAAEKRAQAAGMDVQHVTSAVELQTQERRSHRGEDNGAAGAWIIKLIVVVAIVAVILVFAFPKLRALLHR